MYYYNLKMFKIRNWIDLNKLNWDLLSENPNAINILEKNQDKINWDNLSLNPNAIELLKDNQDKVNWHNLSSNPNIFTYDYKQIKENMKKSGIAEELMAFIFHPRNMNLWNDWGFEEHQQILEFINN
jgi:hypothetical protein